MHLLAWPRSRLLGHKYDDIVETHKPMLCDINFGKNLTLPKGTTMQRGKHTMSPANPGPWFSFKYATWAKQQLYTILLNRVSHSNCCAFLCFVGESERERKNKLDKNQQDNLNNPIKKHNRRERSFLIER
jgi:hypothetical protein